MAEYNSPDGDGERRPTLELTPAEKTAIQQDILDGINSGYLPVADFFRIAPGGTLDKTLDLNLPAPEPAEMDWVQQYFGERISSTAQPAGAGLTPDFVSASQKIRWGIPVNMAQGLSADEVVAEVNKLLTPDERLAIVVVAGGMPGRLLALYELHGGGADDHEGRPGRPVLPDPEPAEIDSLQQYFFPRSRR
jgi:hypothetical protein